MYHNCGGANLVQTRGLFARHSLCVGPIIKFHGCIACLFFAPVVAEIQLSTRISPKFYASRRHSCRDCGPNKPAMSKTLVADHADQPGAKVLIPEKVSPDGLRLLNASFEVHERKGLSAEELIDIIPEYEALIVRSETKVNAALLQAGKKLRVVARAGVGVDNVDLDAATKQGVIVINSPQGNINAAAEHTIALIMAMARNIGEASVSIKSGKWERSKLVGIEVKSKTLAIVGLGKGRAPVRGNVTALSLF